MSGTGEVKETKTARWDKNRSEPKKLREPKTKPDTSAFTSNENSTEANNQESTGSESHNSFEVQNHKVLNSTLNVDAQEFVPKSGSYQSYSSFENQVNPNEDERNDIISYIKNELNNLTLNPGKYESMVNPIGDALAPVINDEAIIKEVINTIVDECISEQNLRYNGARLCNDLINRYGVLRTALLARCQEEHRTILDGCHTNERSLPERLGGFTMLLAELFLQVQVGGCSIKILGQALLDLLEITLSCEIDSRIKHVCQIFKLAGMSLEDLGEPHVTKLNQLFDHLKKVSTYPDLDPNLRFIIQSVLNMRASNWGNCRSQQAAPAVQETNAETYNDPVFYGPDGEIITEEESCFLQENVPLSEDVDDYVCEQDSMDDEVYNAFEQFLQMSEQQKNHQ